MNRVLIIAEAGVNHNGDIETAKKMVETAADAGCDIVKFQTFKAGNIVTKDAEKAEYQIRNTAIGESQYDMLRKLEISMKDHMELIEHCKKRDIMFLSTPFDEESADMLENLGMERYKIPSGEITNRPLLKHIARKNKPIILSTGMSSLGEIEEALGWIYEESNPEITLLHCTSNYPTAYEDVNLNAINTLRGAFKLEAGYSDHTMGIEIPIAAVAIGATVIEKHFTLDRNMKGPDHKASLEPDQLKQMVTAIRNIEKAMGDGVKRPQKHELEVQKVARKSIVAKADIVKGEAITREMLAVKRPGTGIEPKFMDRVIGRRANQSIKKDQILDWNCFL